MVQKWCWMEIKPNPKYWTEQGVCLPRAGVSWGVKGRARELCLQRYELQLEWELFGGGL